MKEGSVLKNILNSYAKISGQSINFAKSAMFFGKRVQPVTKADLQKHFNIQTEGGNAFYLGLPESFSLAKCKLLDYVRERVQQRVNGWNSKYLSQSGKEILLKSVAMAMPSYAMACFQIPRRLCQQINGILSKFWWQTSTEARGIPWISWKRLSRPKEEGGLGFRDLESFNIVLLAKQTWRIVNDPNCLLARMLKNRYFKNSDIRQATLGSRPSYAWRSILAGRDMAKNGIQWVLGSGKSISVWRDYWLPGTEARRATGEGADIHPNLRVSDLIDPRTGDWRFRVLNQIFDTETQPDPSTETRMLRRQGLHNMEAH